MCIVLLTTAHPDYALIVIDNRDEFILRPTSRPHWWTPEPAPKPQDDKTATTPPPAHQPAQEILSSRDLQRAERGTWLGVTRGGNFAVLTNYRETDTHSAAHPVSGQRSRGGMVTAWLGAPPAESTSDFVARMLTGEGGGVQGVGGFSLICGKLRPRGTSSGAYSGAPAGERNIDPLAIVSNRNAHVAQVPWVCGTRGEVYGLSNTSYDDMLVWPKLEDGKQALRSVVHAAHAEGNWSEGKLVDTLFRILDSDTLAVDADKTFEEHVPLLKTSIFIPAIGDARHRAAMAAAVENGKAKMVELSMPDGSTGSRKEQEEAKADLLGEERPDAPAAADDQHIGFETGMYGTQRQTVILVDWAGNVTYTERALWDEHGNPIERGKGDVVHRFKIEGWD